MAPTTPDALEVRLLGGFAVAVGGRPLPAAAWRRKGAAAIVKLLALEPAHRLHREQIVDALWPEHDPEAAAGHLRFVLHQARRRLVEAGAPTDTFLVRDGDGLRLGPPDRIRVDIDAFETAVTRAWGAADPAAIDDALTLYPGDLLPEDPYEDWAEGRRAALRASFLTLLRRAAVLCEEHGELGRAIAALQRLAASEPTDEAAQVALIRLLAETDQRTRALAQVKRLATVLKRELGVAPEPATRALALAIRDGRFPPAVRPLAPPAVAPAASAAPPLPTGAVAFLFTDIEGSTDLWERQPEAMGAALARHDDLLRQTVAAHGGHVFKTVGDEICAAFALVTDAVAAAVAAQRALQAERWPTAAPLRVRMALHVGLAEPRDGDYHGPPLNRVARLLAAGHGGQILLSRPVQELARDALPDGVALRDLGEHHLRDLHHPERIFQAIVPDLPAAFPPLRTPDERLRRLPAPVDALIGRERELAELRQLVTTSRLVTVIGPGGVGKTRLALAVARDLAADVDAAFVDLAAVRDPALALPTVAAALGLREGGDRPLLDALASAIGNDRLLLVLDNFEQILAAASLVTDLLAACPRLTVLVTSRARLRLRGEHDYPLQPLALPERSTDASRFSAAELARYPAVALFVERATAVDPGFAVDDEAAVAIAAICRRLDGLPLAIELAAARTRLLTPVALLARLERPLTLLVGGPRDLPARQQTLRQTIAWSLDLLSAEERAVFRRLAVFAGGFTLEAAERVSNAEAGEYSALSTRYSPSSATADTLDVVAQLADNSLLLRAEAADGEPRFSMLGTIREFGLEQLDAAPEAAAVRAAHASFFLALAEEAEPELFGPRQAAWLDRLEGEHDNFRAALTHLGTAKAAETEAELRMVAALWPFWHVRGYLTEGRRWLESALARAPCPALPADQAGDDAGPATARVRALVGAGTLAASQGDAEQARLHYEEALALAGELGHQRRVTGILGHLGALAHDQGDYRRAAELHGQALALQRASGDRVGIAGALHELGAASLELGDYDVAAGLLSECLALYRALGDQYGVATALTSLGALAFQRGEIDRATALYEEGLGLWRTIGDKQATAIALVNLGEVAHERGDLDRAAVCYDEALPLFERLDDAPGRASALHQLGRLALERGDHARAAVLFADSLSVNHRAGGSAGVAESLEGLAAVAAVRAEATAAARLYGAAEALRETHATPLPAAARADRDRLVAAARAALDEETFAAAWEAGRSLTLDQAVAEAAADRG